MAPINFEIAYNSGKISYPPKAQTPMTKNDTDIEFESGELQTNNCKVFLAVKRSYLNDQYQKAVDIKTGGTSIQKQYEDAYIIQSITVYDVTSPSHKIELKGAGKELVGEAIPPFGFRIELPSNSSGKSKYVVTIKLAYIKNIPESSRSPEVRIAIETKTLETIQKEKEQYLAMERQWDAKMRQLLQGVMCDFQEQ